MTSRKRDPMSYRSLAKPSSCALLALLAFGCSNSDGSGTTADGGSGGTLAATGGSQGLSGSPSGGVAPQASGGVQSTGGGGSPGSGGVTTSGGVTASGGSPASGGVAASGGVTASGGSPGSGGIGVGGTETGGATSGGVGGGLGGSGDGGTYTPTGGTGSGGLDTGTGGLDSGSGGSSDTGGQASGGAETGGQGTCDPSTAQVGYTCESGWSATMSPYILNNNWWGTEDATGQQCVWGTCQDGDTIGWVTNWDWSGGSNSVLTYVSVVFGWQWGFPVEGTGLPIQLSSGKTVNCGWDFTLTEATGSYNVSYDLWLHDTATPPSDGGQTDEIMIWLNTVGGGAVPAGSTTASGIPIADATWTLWEGNVGWAVYSYVRTDNVTSGTLDVMDFLNDLVARGRLSDTKYLTGVQAGIEVRNGTSSGTLTTDGFYCRIE